MASCTTNREYQEKHRDEVEGRMKKLPKWVLAEYKNLRMRLKEVEDDLAIVNNKTGDTGTKLKLGFEHYLSIPEKSILYFGDFRVALAKRDVLEVTSYSRNKEVVVKPWCGNLIKIVNTKLEEV